MTKQELIKKTKTELSKVHDYLSENKNALFDYFDLKLHDAFYYDYSEKFPLCAQNERERGESFLFYDFCDDYYNMFKDDLSEIYNIDFEKQIKYINHTSKFYLWKTDENNCFNLLNTLLNDYFYSGSSVYLESDLKTLEFDAEFYTSKDVVEHLTDIANGDFFEYVKSETEKPITIFKVLSDFKENQIESFEEFLTYFENDLQEERDAENARILTDLNNALNIQRFYGIPNATMQELKKCIYAYN